MTDPHRSRNASATVHHSGPQPPIEWLRTSHLVSYPEADAAMRRRAEAIADRRAHELVWLLEHPPLYTRGLRTADAHVVNPGTLPVFETDRGGQLTYHGPGQRIAYVMIDVAQRFDGDVRAFVRQLEAVVIDTLDSLGVPSWNDPGRPGVWVHDPAAAAGEAKIAAVGLKVRRGVSFHGVSLNVAPDLAHFASIVPCGLEGSSVASLESLGRNPGMADVDRHLISHFEQRLGRMIPSPEPSPEPSVRSR